MEKSTDNRTKLIGAKPSGVIAVVCINIIIFNAKFILFDAKFIILNTQSIIVDAKFINCNTNRYLSISSKTCQRLLK